MISVAMTSYNGENYIGRQIESVLANLSKDDELVISDDGSRDQTLSIIQSFNDTRIKVYKGPHKGVNQNFANAIAHCNGDFIFLCDQDDVWYSNKVRTVMDAFHKYHCLLVQHDARVTDGKGNTLYESFSKHRRVRPGFIKNYIRNTYHGCCIAFSSTLKKNILPMPYTGCFHDCWIGLIANLKGETVFIEDVLMDYKRYDGNLSSFMQYPKLVQIKNRALLGINLVLFFLHSKRRL